MSNITIYFNKDSSLDGPVSQIYLLVRMYAI